MEAMTEHAELVAVASSRCARTGLSMASFARAGMASMRRCGARPL
jgi:hypothetical protein